MYIHLAYVIVTVIYINVINNGIYEHEKISLADDRMRDCIRIFSFGHYIIELQDAILFPSYTNTLCLIYIYPNGAALTARQSDDTFISECHLNQYVTLRHYRE